VIYATHGDIGWCWFGRGASARKRAKKICEVPWSGYGCCEVGDMAPHVLALRYARGDAYDDVGVFGDEGGHGASRCAEDWDHW